MTKWAFKETGCFVPNLASGNNRGFVQLNFQIFASKSCSVGCDYSLVNVTLDLQNPSGQACRILTCANNWRLGILLTGEHDLKKKKKNAVTRCLMQWHHPLRSD